MMSSLTSKSRPLRWRRSAITGIGGAVVIAILASTQPTMLPLLMGSFGSSAVLLFGFPDSGFCKPGRVVGAHTLCTALGLLCLHAFGHEAWVVGLSVGLSIALMLGLRLVHPPAGSNPLLVFALAPDWSFLLWPTLLGSTALVTLAWFWHKNVSLLPETKPHA